MGLLDLINRFVRLEGRVRRTLPITCVAPLVAQQTTGGTIIRDTRAAGYNENFHGWITNKGPNGEPDYATGAQTAMYWVKRGKPMDGFSENDTLAFDAMPIAPNLDSAGNPILNDPVTVTNLPEMPLNTLETRELPTPTHYLEVGRQVRVRAVYSADGLRHFVMNEGPGNAFFPVLCATNGGSAGMCGASATWTYNIKRLGETNTLATGLTPEYVPYRESGVICVAGTKGLAYFNNGTNVALWSVNETISSRLLQIIVKDYSCDGSGNLTYTTNWAHVVCGNS